jgi:membrane protein DedA with SNARE-associated domain
MPALDDEPRTHRDRPVPSRRTAALVITPIICFIALATLGDALTTTWADQHPLALLALNSRNRIVLLVTNRLDAVPYYVVGTLRLLASDPLFFLLGVLYGDAAVRWVERKSKTFGEQIRLYEKLFQKASYPLVFIAPNNFICIFAGAAGMPIPGFVIANVAGTITRLYLLRVVGDVFSSPIDAVLDFFARYRLPLLIASVALVALTVVFDRRQGKSEIGALRELEQELESGFGPDVDGEGGSA